jgi:adenylate cyclase
VTYAIALGYQSDLVMLGFDLADEALVNETRDGLHLAESFGDAYALSMARWTHGSALLRSGDPRRETGIELLHQSRSGGLDIYGSLLDAELAVDMVRHGHRHVPIEALRAAVQAEIESGETLFVGCSLAVLVQLLASQGGSDGVAQAQDMVTRFEADLPGVPEPAVQLWLLRCRALLANAVRDVDGYQEHVTRYRDLAEELDARDHIAVAERLATSSGAEP